MSGREFFTNFWKGAWLVFGCLTILSCGLLVLPKLFDTGRNRYGAPVAGVSQRPDLAGPDYIGMIERNPNGILPAAADSVEGELTKEGKRWAPTNGPIEVGSYVEDMLKGRANQPAGRGFIGKVTDTDGQAATVDFGRGYKTGIMLREIRLVAVTK